MPGLVIERDVLIEAPVEVVWRTVTEPDQMSLWFADRVELVIEPGAHGYMRFGDQGGPVVVQTVDPPTRFSFRWNYPSGRRAGGRQLDARRVHADPRGRRADPLRVTESGHELRDWPDAEKQRYADEHQRRMGRIPGPTRQVIAKRQRDDRSGR